MRRAIALITNEGDVFRPNGELIYQRPRETPRAVAVVPEKPRQELVAKPIDGIEAVTRHLAAVVKLAQGMNDADQRRVRDFVHAASSTLAATTYLPRGDQASFQQALREAARND